MGTASWGNVFINASWQFNVSGLYQGPWGFAAGANFFGRQGYSNPYWVGAGPGTLEGGGLLLIDRVDTYRFPNVYELDLRVQKTLAIGPVTLIPTVEIFNVANGNSVLQRFQGVGSYNQGKFNQDPNFNQITEVQSPRIVRLGLQVNF